MKVRTFSTQACRVFTRNQGRGRSASPNKRNRGPDGKVYGRTDSAGQQSSLTAKRRRRSNSHEQFVSKNSGVSNVDPSSDLINASTSPAAELENYGNVKGWMIG